MNADVVVTAIVGFGTVVVAALTLGHVIRKERRARVAQEASLRRELAERESAFRREQAQREAAEERERAQREAAERDQRQHVSELYLSCLGSACALLDAILVDADNADALISDATKKFAELQGIGHGALVTVFGSSSPVIWTDSAIRKLLSKALGMARDARAEGQTGEAARQTRRLIQTLTEVHVDEVPRQLMRWATEEATERWPESLTHFEGHKRYEAQLLAREAGCPLPDELVAEDQVS